MALNEEMMLNIALYRLKKIQSTAGKHLPTNYIVSLIQLTLYKWS